ncbi:MAG: hypothetical protein H0V49_11215, partial [Nocardioidaceae bacterium]|nr:hypothetical protein [Nocardioidaceae bacterium]
MTEQSVSKSTDEPGAVDLTFDAPGNIDASSQAPGDVDSTLYDEVRGDSEAALPDGELLDKSDTLTPDDDPAEELTAADQVGGDAAAQA